MLVATDGVIMYDHHSGCCTIFELLIFATKLSASTVYCLSSVCVRFGGWAKVVSCTLDFQNLFCTY